MTLPNAGERRGNIARCGLPTPLHFLATHRRRDDPLGISVEFREPEEKLFTMGPNRLVQAVNNLACFSVLPVFSRFFQSVSVNKPVDMFSSSNFGILLISRQFFERTKRAEATELASVLQDNPRRLGKG